MWKIPKDRTLQSIKWGYKDREIQLGYLLFLVTSYQNDKRRFTFRFPCWKIRPRIYKQDTTQSFFSIKALTSCQMNKYWAFVNFTVLIWLLLNLNEVSSQSRVFLIMMIWKWCYTKRQLWIQLTTITQAQYKAQFDQNFKYSLRCFRHFMLEGSRVLLVLIWGNLTVLPVSSFQSNWLNRYHIFTFHLKNNNKINPTKQDFSVVSIPFHTAAVTWNIRVAGLESDMKQAEH